MSESIRDSIEGAGGGGGCFRAGTRIQQQHGKSTPIELLKEGDEVLAFDERGELHAAKVVKVHYHPEPQPILHVRFWRGETFITPNHWVLNQYGSFVEMGNLTTHDALVDGMEHLRPIIGAELVAHEPVWNLTVEPHHTFIADGIRVHNGGHRQRYPEIQGAGGGGGGKGGGGRAAIEADDTLQSKTSVGIIDLIGEGEIGGLVNGAQSVYLNGTPLMNADGSYNFADVVWEQRTGTQNQLPIGGSSAFDAISSPMSVGVKVQKATPYSVTMTNPLANQVMIIVAVPQLMQQDTTTGDVNGTSVKYKFEISVDGAPFVALGDPELTIEGKTRSRYQRSHVFDVPSGTLRIIRMTRITDDAGTAAIANDLYFDSIIERVTSILHYPNSALVAVTVNAAQFTSIPSRSYLVDGLYIKVPVNYDPVARTYSGTWNGTFKLAVSNNPAWIMYDILTDERYGLGAYIAETQVDKATLYQIGRYCDELVPDGMGGMEPRFTANIIINTISDAYKLVGQIASIFRGMGFWAGSGVGFTCDYPRDPSMIYNQANVIDGVFKYAGSSRKNRHSVAMITWNDPAESFKQKIEYVEDAELISKFGVRKTDMIAFGCTSRAQAHRLGRWILYTEKYESQIISFSVGSDSAMLLPGETILIHDDHKSGKRMGGRATGATTTSLNLDNPITLTAATGTLIMVAVPVGVQEVQPDGTTITKPGMSYEERQVLQGAGTHSTLTWTTPLSATPVPNAIYIVSEPSLVPMTARVVALAQGDKPGTFTITAIEHNPSKYDAIEYGYKLEELPTSIIDPNQVAVPTNLTIVEEQFEVLPGTIGTKLAISWSGTMPSYEVSYSKLNASGNPSSWTTLTTTYASIETPSIQKGVYRVKVYGINAFGVKTATALTADYTVLGKTYAPGDVTGFAVSKRITDLLLTWNPVLDVDIRGYELRVGPSWDTGTVLTNSFMGTSFIHDQSEAGTYFYHIRSIDTSGNYSENVTTVPCIIDAPQSVSQFDCIQNGSRIEFRWNANPEIDIVGYEIREGASWPSSTYITEVKATTFSLPSNSVTGTRTFWIKAIGSPGIYSDVAVFSTTDVAASSDRNVLYTDDERASGWLGSKYNLTPVDTYLQLDAGKTYGEYTWGVSLPQTYRARNSIVSTVDAIVLDSTNWVTASYTWSSAQANRGWVTSGDANAINLNYYISRWVGLDPSYVEGIGLNNTTAAEKGSTVASSVGVTYSSGRFLKGALISDFTSLSWNVSIPSVFNTTFWAIPQTVSGKSVYWVARKSDGAELVLSYDASISSFVLEDSYLNKITLPYSIAPQDRLLIGIVQTATARKLYVGKLNGTSASATANQTPLGPYAVMKVSQR